MERFATIAVLICCLVLVVFIAYLGIFALTHGLIFIGICAIVIAILFVIRLFLNLSDLIDD